KMAIWAVGLRKDYFVKKTRYEVSEGLFAETMPRELQVLLAEFEQEQEDLPEISVYYVQQKGGASAPTYSPFHPFQSGVTPAPLDVAYASQVTQKPTYGTNVHPTFKEFMKFFIEYINATDEISAGNAERLLLDFLFEYGLLIRPGDMS